MNRKIAVTDIGSNTVKMRVYECDEKKKKIRPVRIEVRHCRLITHIKGGIMTNEGVDVLVGTLTEFKEISLAEECVSFSAFATASLRRAANASEVISETEKRTGEKIELISGEDEAYLSFIGATYGKKLPGEGVVFDMGGGSTEVIFYRGEEIINKTSLPFGSLSLLNDYLADNVFSPEGKTSLEKYVEKTYLSSAITGSSRTACLVGGTSLAIRKLLTTLPKPPADKDKAHPEDLKTLGNTISKGGAEVEKMLETTVSERRDTVVSGLYAYIKLLELVRAKEVRFSKTGIREGYAIKRILEW